MNPEILKCRRMFTRSVERRRKELEHELVKLDEVEMFVEEAFECMNDPPVSAEDSLWTAIRQEKELRGFEFEELIYRGELDKNFQEVDSALSIEVKYRMRLLKDNNDDSDDDGTDFNLIEALSANTVATPAAKIELRQIATEYKKARAGKRKRHECGCSCDCEKEMDVEYSLAQRILALLLKSPEFSRLVKHVSQNEHLLPKE
jgi:hypothetical protein